MGHRNTIALLTAEKKHYHHFFIDGLLVTCFRDHQNYRLTVKQLSPGCQQVIATSRPATDKHGPFAYQKGSIIISFIETLVGHPYLPYDSCDLPLIHEKWFSLNEDF